MICKKCGRKTPERGIYCCQCGAKLDKKEFAVAEEEARTHEMVKVALATDEIPETYYLYLDKVIKHSVFHMRGVRLMLKPGTYSRRSNPFYAVIVNGTAVKYDTKSFTEKEVEAYKMLRSKIVKCINEVAEKYREGEL